MGIMPLILIGGAAAGAVVGLVFLIIALTKK